MESEKPKREKAPRLKTKSDPKLVKAARELRDWWMDQLDAAGAMLGAGKYDVARLTDSATRDGVGERNVGSLPAPIVA